jgi:hypothetical protein
MNLDDKLSGECPSSTIHIAIDHPTKIGTWWNHTLYNSMGSEASYHRSRLYQSSLPGSRLKEMMIGIDSPFVSGSVELCVPYVDSMNIYL